MLINVASISYGVAAIAFLILTLMLLTTWRGRLHWVPLAVAASLTAVWAATLALHTYFDVGLSWFAHFIEIARSGSWIVFLLLLLRPLERSTDHNANSFRPYAKAIVIYLLLFGGITLYLSLFATPFPGLAVSVNTMGRLVLAVIGMLLVEQLFRNTSEKERWGIKFACLAIAGLFVFDFYLYSDALLFRVVNIEIWSARGMVDALTVPLIALSLARNPKWNRGFLVSRRILFHSATLLGSAVYLLLMAAAGYYLKFFGGSWGSVLQVAFLFGAVVLLLILLFSGSVRAWLKVFISKHFYNYNYDYREEWIRFTRALSVSGPGVEARVIEALAALVESPGGALYIARESGKCEPAAQWNLHLKGKSESINAEFCQFMRDRQWVIDLDNLDMGAETHGGFTVPDWLKEEKRAWLVLPLLLHGNLFGFVVLEHARSKVKLNWEVLDLLKIAGTQAASYLAQQDSANALMVARQFDSFNRMSTFMVHDLKNLVAQLSLLLANAEKHKDNPEFQKDMLETVDHSVQKMKVLLQKLARGHAEETVSAVRLDDLLRKTVESKSPYEPKPSIQIIDPNIVIQANWERLERVIGHIIQNAIEATPRDGTVSITLSRLEQQALIEIKDTGVGMTQEFIHEKLFSPFESTKVAGMGIGVFETKEYVKQLGGKLDVQSQPNVGTTFKLSLPI